MRRAMSRGRSRRFLLPVIAKRRAEGADGSVPIFDGLLGYRTLHVFKSECSSRNSFCA